MTPLPRHSFSKVSTRTVFLVDSRSQFWHSRVLLASFTSPQDPVYLIAGQPCAAAADSVVISLFFAPSGAI
jgi:hypothetical protein